MDSTKKNCLKLKFSSKARTLQDLSTNFRSGKILPLVKFSQKDFKKNSKEIIENVQNFFKEDYLIIRSSAKNEDTFNQSLAGSFKSFLNVPKNDKTKIIENVNQVFNSYKKVYKENEVFIQPMLKNIKIAGVAFTCDLDTLSPYYVISYDEKGRSDTITGGLSGKIKTYVHFKASRSKCKDKRMNKLIKACKELEKIFENSFLDIEFAFDEKNLYILQVRPIVLKNKENLSSIDLRKPLFKIYKKIEKISSPHPNLLGNKTIFGVMPDWNPAEIIGCKPKQLSISFYKEIITDNIWAYQRNNYGYRNLRSHPLMVSFLGIPYVDVRVDFNSFLPKTLNNKIGEKLINYYLDKLKAKPYLHDKVEFEIVFSCFYFNLPDKLKELKKYKFTANEIRLIKKSLLELTSKIINPKKGLYKKDLKKIEILKKRYEEIVNSDMPIVNKIYWLVEDCKRYGSLPFAGIARAAFIATQILKSFIDLDIITEKEYNLFLNSLSTITKKMNHDLFCLSQSKITNQQFLEKYGHLRPGTYDILSLRYDENFKDYFSSKVQPVKSKNFKFSKIQLNKMQKIIREKNINASSLDLIKFIRESIEGREYSKYIFTKSISKVLALIEELGKKYRIKKNDLAHIDIKTLLNLYSTLDHRNLKDILKSDINKNRELYDLYTKAVRLPSLITHPEEIYGFYLQSEEPNYVTLKQVRSKIIKEEEFGKNKFDEKIVFIKSADPGYDFLFSKKIVGLITQFGGANSHMAVRCAELGIPALIGVGEQNFNFWAKANILELDCLNKQVKIIS